MEQNEIVLKQRLQEAVGPVIEELLGVECTECALDTLIATSMSSFKLAPIDFRLKLFASLQMTFNMQTGELLDGDCE